MNQNDVKLYHEYLKTYGSRKMKFKMKLKRLKLLLLALSVMFLISFVFYLICNGFALIFDFIF